MTTSVYYAEHMHKNSKNTRAFTLMELSIVLVILGLLAGGVLSGQALIRAAELRNATTEVMKIFTGFNAFMDQYRAMPGDMANASAYWGAADGSTGSTPACATINALTAADPKATCNGDGNGHVDGISNTGASYEPYRGWQQMANAGLLAGSFAGIPDPVTHGNNPGFNSPTIAISNGTVGYGYFDPISGNSDPNMFDGPYGNVVTLAGARNLSYTPPQIRIFSAQDAWNIDTKFDDGKPASGAILSNKNTNYPTCTTGADSTANYLLTSTDLGCNLWWVID